MVAASTRDDVELGGVASTDERGGGDDGSDAGSSGGGSESEAKGGTAAGKATPAPASTSGAIGREIVEDTSRRGRLLLQPGSPVDRLRILVVVLVLLYNAVTVPLRHGFELGYAGYLTTDILFDLVLLADIFMNFHTCILDGETGAFTSDPRAIAHDYASGWLLFDVAASLPIDYFFLGTPAVRLVRFIRLARLKQYMREQDNWDIFVRAELIRLFNQLVLLFLFLHWHACYYFYFSRDAGFGSTAYVASAEDGAADFTSQYLRAFVWSTEVVVSAGGGGDATNDDERRFKLFNLLFSLALVVTLIGEVGAIFANLDANAVLFRQKLATVNGYMSYRHMPGKLRAQVRDFYGYLWVRNKGMDEHTILTDLPASLRTEVNRFLNVKIIQKVGFFTEDVLSAPGFLTRLLSSLRPIVASPGTYIVTRGEVGKEMYFLSTGEVQVETADDKRFSFGGGTAFGEIALLLRNGKRTASIKALTFCELFVLGKDAFRTLMIDFPEFRERVLLFGQERLMRDGNETAARELAEMVGDMADADAESNVHISAGQLARIVDEVTRKVVRGIQDANKVKKQ